MAIAGRVAIVPKGEYSNAVTYDKLDLVMFNNDAYIAKKASTGIEPTNDEYWMLILNNVVAEDLEKIIDGTTPAGDSNKLGGKGASEWQKEIDNIQTTVRATLSTAGWYRVAEFNSSGGSAENFDISIRTGFNSSYPEYARLRARNVHTSHAIQCLDRVNVSGTPLFTKARIAYDSSKVYFEVYYSANSANPVRVDISNGLSPWADGGWKAITPTLTEETVSGVTVTTTYDIPANATPATSADLANYLPLSGGTLTSSHSNMVLNIISALTTGAYIRFSDGNNVACFLGVNREGKPAYSNGNSEYDILHTGNKPSGTYTGNGSATSRTIETGGSGDTVIIHGARSTGGVTIAIVGWGGTIAECSGTVTGIPAQNARCISGNIILATADAHLNESGTKYSYQVL